MIINRKMGHIEVCYSCNVEFKDKKTLFDDIHFIHNSLPEINLDDVNLSTTFLGHKLNAPIMISAMTGGNEKAYKLNAILASAAEKLGIAMGVGSQRIAIEKPELSYTFSIVREVAPNAFIVSNLGAAQLSLGYGLKEAKRAVDMIDANAIAIHFNPLQEAIQPEGEPYYSNVMNVIKLLCSNLNIPVIAKETGSGFSREVAIKLEKIGVSAIDIAGAGGTSWAAVEYYRSLELNDEDHMNLAYIFWNWGIPTAASLCEVRSAVNMPIIASGGIRSGLDAAKALALGADCVGVALPLLKIAIEGGFEGVCKFINKLINELKIAMFLVGAKNIVALKEVPILITGFLSEWLNLRGINPAFYAHHQNI